MLIGIIMKAVPSILVTLGLAFFALLVLALRGRMKVNRYATPARRRDDKILTVKDVADICDVSPCTVRKWFSQGLPVARIGKSTLVRRKDLDAFVESHISLTIGG